MEEEKIKDKIEESVEVKTEIIIGEQKIKEMEFSVNTASSGEVMFLTNEINGFLEGIIIHSEQPTQILITEEISNIVLFDVTHFNSSGQFISIRQGAVSPKGESFRDSYTKIPLNGVLGVVVSGPKHTLVNFIVRYS